MNELLTATYDAEDSLIGSILIDSSCGHVEAIRKVRNIVAPDDFQQSIDRLIYAAMLSCEVPHQINVAHEMVRLGTLVDGAIAHMSLCVSTTTGLEYLDYAKAVREYSLNRQGKVVTRIKGHIE